MKKHLLTEMAIYGEDEVFSLQSVADVSTSGLEQLEGPNFINHIASTIDTSNLPENYVLNIQELNEIYSHHCAYRILKKAAFLALPQIIQAKLVLSSWKKKKKKDGSKSKDNRLTGLIGAPITIDKAKYLCLVGMRKNRNGIITPYTITLKDGNGVIVGDKKVNSDIIVPDSNNGTSAFGSTHLSTDTASLDANSPSNANIDKNNKTEKNESKNMTKKNTIRLTESELKKVITESVKNILKEEYDDEYDFQEELIGQIRNDLFSVLKKYDNHLLDSGVMAGWAYEYISYVHKILKQILPYNQWIKQNKN